MKKKIETPQTAAPVIETVSLYKTARQRYLNYALSVITSRALPDVRDGLKPVQRRILYGMQEMHLSHEAKPQKSAQIVGQVMGRYHPHGDQAIYDALVRQAQPFTLRYPFVDGQGNFGSMDGDSAAHMRYTEARLQPVAAAMLQDLDEHIIEFQPNYSGTFREPTVLPAAIPNLLINGSMGIAVGMATNVPPHNLSEAVRGCMAVIDNPNISLDALMDCIPAPDFPTGGRILTPRAEIKKIYESGRGAIDIQGEFDVENDGKKTRIIISSIPYAVNKHKIFEAIRDIINANKLPQLVNVHDESTKDVRLVLDLKSGADPNLVMAYLYKHTELQSRFNVNMTCIIPGGTAETENGLVYQPKRLGLRDIIDHFLQFRLEVVTKRLSWQLAQILERTHLLEGFQKIFDALNEAIEIIRNAEDRADASQKLCARFDMDDVQANAILEMRLYKLAKLEIHKITTELEAKRNDAKHIQTLLANEQKRWRIVREELEFALKTYGDERRTKLTGCDLSKDYSPENYIIEEDCYVIITKSGLFKRQKTVTDVSSIRTKEMDAVAFVRFGSTRSMLILLSSLGKAYTIRVDNVPATTGHGAPLATVFKLEDGEQIIGAYLDDPRAAEAQKNEKQTDRPKSLIDWMTLSNAPENAPENAPDERYIVAVSKQAQVVRMGLPPFTAVSTSNGRIYMRLSDGDFVIHASILNGDGFVSCISSNTRAIVFPVSEIPALKTAGKGVRALALDPGTHLAAARVVESEDQGVRVRISDNRELTISERRMMKSTRGAKGRLLLRRGTVLEVFENPIEIDDNNPKNVN